ncbi:MAG TPA: SPW repeat protein [Polyangiaceae bacterium]|nr:SPW repeat protein [Polyangiaceae bacterium]
MSNQSARLLNIILGVWLFISAFLWVHTTPQFNNAWVVGVLTAGAAALAMAAPGARYLNTALAVWLFISTWALPLTNRATAWNNVIVSVLVFVFSLLGLPRAERPITTRPI